MLFLYISVFNKIYTYNLNVLKRKGGYKFLYTLQFRLLVS